MNVGLLYHPLVPESRKMGEHLRAVGEEYGHDVWLESAWESEQIVELADECSLLITLGGDGTILRAARASLREGPDGRRVTPLLLAVDYGTLGFLTELPPEKAVEGLRKVLGSNAYWIEERTLLQARLIRDGAIIEEREALNDVVLARADGPHAVKLTLHIDGVEVARYTADALIVASPTGSTAYAQGAGGPILAPGVDAILVVPVAPHFSLMRSFVIPSSSQVSLWASARRGTVVTVDGQINLPYQEGDELQVRQGTSVARFVRLGPPNYFFASFQSKLGRA